MRHKFILTILLVALAYTLVEMVLSFSHKATEDRLVIAYAKSQTPENRQALDSEHGKIVRRRYTFAWLTVANFVVIIVYGALHDRKRLA
jgi:hypothetical protein